MTSSPRPRHDVLPGSLALVAIGAVVAIMAVNGFLRVDPRTTARHAAAAAPGLADRVAGCTGPAGMPLPPNCPAPQVR